MAGEVCVEVLEVIEDSQVVVEVIEDAATVVEVLETYVEVIEVESFGGLPGPPGEDGSPGEDGAPGAPGADGADGADYDPAEADLRYVNVTGDAMTGPLTIEAIGPQLLLSDPLTVTPVALTVPPAGGLKVSNEGGVDSLTVGVDGSIYIKNGDPQVTFRGTGLAGLHWESYALRIRPKDGRLSTADSMNVRQPFQIGEGVNATDAATKGYVDARIWKGTQAAYDAIVTKDPTVLYVVTE